MKPLILSTLLILGLSACSSQTLFSGKDPDKYKAYCGKNNSIKQLSQNQRYLVSVHCNAYEIPLRKFHDWTVHISDKSGRPVEDALILIEGGMPQHNHGLPSNPQTTTYLGDGNYKVEGMKFNMPGVWVLHLEINENAINEHVSFNITIQ